MKNYCDLSRKELIDLMVRDAKVRRAVTRESHDWFFHLYFVHYIEYETAPFQREIIHLTEDETKRILAITAFRGSAKSTLITLSYVLWSVLGRQKKKFVIILGRTQAQANQYLKNLKDEIMRNEMLRFDLGPFEEQEDEWKANSIVLPRHGVRISAASMESTIRGVRHGQHRPDLVVCDDLEDSASVKTKEGREKTYQWITGEVIPAGTRKTRFIFIGNLLHADCLLKRIERDIVGGLLLTAAYKEYPLVTKDGICLWRGKYPTDEAIEEEHRMIGSEVSWQREYLLRIVPDDGQVIYPEWIRTYHELPDEKCRLVGIAIDLAISQKDTADCTAMVAARVYGSGHKMRIYILPQIINKRLTPWETLIYAKALVDVVGKGRYTRIYVEDVGYQGSLVDLLNRNGYFASGFPVRGQDKRSRLMIASQPVQEGCVFFPERGAEALITQLLGFGSERYDDLADAFSMLIIKLMEQKGATCKVTMLGRTPLAERHLKRVYR